MIRVLLVDDEVSVVDTLQAVIPWEQLDVHVVEVAYSAMEALNTLEQHPFDLLVTDIRMPKISGIELAEQVRSRWPYIKCIFLTGFTDFEYARQAIQNQVVDYIVKPVANHAFCEKLRTIIDQIKKEWEDNHIRQLAEYTLRENIPLLRHNLLRSLLQSQSRALVNLDKQLITLELPFKTDRTAALLLIKLEGELAAADFYSQSLYEYSLTNIAQETFQDHFSVWYCMDPLGYLIMAVTLNDEHAGSRESEATSWLIRDVEQLRVHVEHYLKGTVSVLVGSWRSFPEGIQQGYQELLSMLHKYVGMEHDFIVVVQEHEKNQSSIRGIHRLYEPPTLSHLLEAGLWDQGAEKLEDVFAELKQRFSESREHLLEAGNILSATFIHIAHHFGQPLSEIAGNDYDRMYDPRTFQSLAQLKEWSVRILGRLRKESENEQNTKRSLLIRSIHEFIDLHLASDISLQTVADHVGLHPAYLSAIYKKETGLNLTEYTLQQRMQRASDMLLHSELKVYEITERLGYQHPPYFIKVFKQFYGVTPQEFREPSQNKKS
ncbi:response regulator [Paenibacillus sp. UMB7766-LJ446]|uniref:response regulator n=1 Tax=Paenibacillus sp. UMB7766-LJ446 TaxID=3046313 RepID=UPI00254BA704|nr:response regulator [Paenibacillus sp. UMB7766-LJ446]MDK8189914.1 response regulator [Paenibacillus sp. UMB7766-LJ446]